MRHVGTLRSWNEDRGYGFIAPTHGGREVFVHLSAFRRDRSRPLPGERMSYELGEGRDGKPQALNVVRSALGEDPVRRAAPAGGGARESRPARLDGPDRTPRHDSPTQWGTATFVAIPAFLLLYLALAAAWRVPNWVGGAYLLFSLVCFHFYAADKAAAQVKGQRRVPEKTLLLLGLVGGWPGAIVAQQLRRHKSSKLSFRAAFWTTVLMNVLAFVLLSALLWSPPGRRLFALA
jgi:uncharacterized membrane protein YsdA (DUF1294 family)/cold shock CspA family protein